MCMNLHIQKILNKKITRREFLVYFGMIIFTLLDLSRLLKSISIVSPTKSTKKPKLANVKRTFGVGSYGV